MTTLRQVRAELAVAIAGTIPAHDTLPASPIPPFAVVMWPDTVEFARTLSGRHEYVIPITVYASLADITAGQVELDGYVLSVRSAVHAHTPPAGLWVEAWVTTADNFRPESLGDLPCIAVDLNTTVIA